MALDDNTLKTGIKNLLASMETKDQDAKDEFATTLASLIKTFVMSGTVTVATGIPVSTTGSPSAQTGATTSTGTGTIS